MAWPAWRTDPSAAQLLSLRATGGAALTALVAVPAAALFLRSSVVALSLDRGEAPETGLAGSLIDLLSLVILSPGIAWACLLAAVPATRWLAARGRAGWAAVALACAGLGALTILFAAALTGPLIASGGALTRLGFVGSGFGLLFGLTFWLVLRLSRPEAFHPDGMVTRVFE